MSIDSNSTLNYHGTSDSSNATSSSEALSRTDQLIQWTGNNYLITVLISLIYLLTIGYIRRVMVSRDPFGLRLPLAIWNIGLTVYSLASTIVLNSYLVQILWRQGFIASICEGSSIQDNHQVKLWLIAFCWSKAIELGDTLFIVLRKQKLIFLHVYHHAATLIYGCYVFGKYQPPYILWFSGINTFIHTLMYSYYGARAIKIPVPRRFNVCLTSLQIIQMIIGAVITTKALIRNLSGLPCDTNVTIDIIGFLLYLSYLILFSNFFIYSYIKPKAKQFIKSQ